MSTHDLRDRNGNLLGRINTLSDGRQELRDSNGNLKGHYNRGCTEFCVNGLMAGNRRTSRSGYDRKYKESSTQRPH
jgi:hypothetical protein